MATIHLGRLLGPVGFSRTVAIKRLHPQYAKDPEFVAMFLDEARLAARIQHPNVVPTLDVVSTDGELFLVMEYVQGETLSRLTRAAREKGERVPPRIATAIMAGVAHGLHAAHEAKDERGNPLGIVHRDVSPQNVLVGVDGVPRVLDFGVAKAAVRLQTTREGQLKGKLAYMAPEQLQAGLVNRLTDVYAAGVLLWEALTTRRLFEADSEGQLLSLVLKGTVESPSAIVPELAPVLGEIAMLALERSQQCAMASEVGEWVEGVAREMLAKRAERIAEIESSAHARSGSSPPTSPSMHTQRTRSSEAATQVAPAPVTVAPPAPPSSPASLTPSATRSVMPPDATPSSPAIAPASSGAMPSARKTRRKILVIDDSEVMLNRIRAALEAEGYDVLTTSRAVGNARHIPSTDLCIIDYHMPGIDGGTVISSLKAAATSGAHPCLFYLYTSDPQIAKEHQKLGFDGCFTDKGSEDALVRQVRAVFRMLQMRAMKKK